MRHCASLLRQKVLPPGGGPRTLVLHSAEPVGVMQRLAPLLAATRVRTLCVHVLEDDGACLRGLTRRLPGNVHSLRVIPRTLQQALELLAEPPGRPLVLTLVGWLRSPRPNGSVCCPRCVGSRRWRQSTAQGH